MLYGFLSEILVFFHFCFAVFVALGGLLSFWWRLIIWLHLPALVWGAFIEFFGKICPLTPIENAWRAVGRAAGYEAGFVEQHLYPILYPSGLTRSIQLVLGALVVAVNTYVYWRLLRDRAKPATH
jgi:hypothetical protein